MKKQALILNKFGKNVYVKIPVCNSKGVFSGKIIKYLSSKKVKINITAVYTAKQTKSILKVINKNSDVIISIFIGRASDSGKDPIPELKKKYLDSKKNLKSKNSLGKCERTLQLFICKKNRMSYNNSST